MKLFQRFKDFKFRVVEWARNSDGLRGFVISGGMAAFFVMLGIKNGDSFLYYMATMFFLSFWIGWMVRKR